jgi:hypothetical protein
LFIRCTKQLHADRDIIDARREERQKRMLSATMVFPPYPGGGYAYARWIVAAGRHLDAHSGQFGKAY